MFTLEEKRSLQNKTSLRMCYRPNICMISLWIQFNNVELSNVDGKVKVLHNKWTAGVDWAREHCGVLNSVYFHYVSILLHLFIHSHYCIRLPVHLHLVFILPFDLCVLLPHRTFVSSMFYTLIQICIIESCFPVSHYSDHTFSMSVPMVLKFVL